MLIVLFFFFITIKMPIAISLGCSALIMIALDPSINFSIISGVVYNGLAKYVMLAIPYFILAGQVMEYTGISKRLIDLARVLVGHYRGGMIVVVAAVSCFFGAISGSGTACIAAIGGIAIPAMVKDGYDRGYSSALVSISAGIGLVIPPSLTFVVYAMLTSTSIVKLFTAGIVPGIFLGAMFAIAGLWAERKNKNIVITAKANLKERLVAFRDAFWGLLSPIIILGGIYSGYFTPTEAAGVSVVYCLVVGFFIYKELRLKDLWTISISAAKATAMIMLIIACASVFGWCLSTSHLAADMGNAMLAVSSNKYVLLGVMAVIYLIAGCFVEPTSMCYIFLPMFTPLCKQLDIDLIHFGVITVTASCIALVTPPVGVNLYVGARIGEIASTENARKLVPFLVLSFMAFAVIMYVPQLSLALDSILRTYP
jgi:C4-dicarboxylate transporter DctM subunit